MTHFGRARLRTLALMAATAAALAACGAATPSGTSLSDGAGCRGRAPGGLDFRVGGKAPMLPPAPAQACAQPAAVAMTARGAG